MVLEVIELNRPNALRDVHGELEIYLRLALWCSGVEAGEVISHGLKGWCRMLCLCK